MVTALVGVARAPFNSRIRQGFACPPQLGTIDWTGLMSVGSAGATANSEIRAQGRNRGTVMSGPHTRVEPGRYRVTVNVNFFWPPIARHLIWLLSRFPLRGYAVVLTLIAGRREFARKEVGAAFGALSMSLF